MHQVLFSPPHQTLLRAVNLGFLDGFPFLTADLIHKHLAKSPATAKGRLKLRPAGFHSTCHERIHHAHTNVFCFAALADKQQGTFYTDCTGRLPSRALNGQHLFFVAYDYNTNYIFALPISSTSDNDILTAFKQTHDMLTKRGYTPQFNVTDNQAASTIRAFMHDKGGTVQLVEPNNHRVNAAERAIQTFKDHFISGLRTTDPTFPFQLWNYLTDQAVITCNLLRRSRIHPDISAYEQLRGKKIRLERPPDGPPRHPRRHTLFPPHTHIVGPPQNRCLVLWPIGNPLPLL